MSADLAAIEARLRASIVGDPEEVAHSMADLFAAGGKRLRPALVLLAAWPGSYDLDVLTPAAMAVELTHAATLVHDDVIDRAELRRGRPTVAAALGDEPAIVIGDFYFAKAYEQAALTRSAEVVEILARSVMEICAGEVRQQAIRYRYVPDVPEYMSRIEAKTASLLAACCEIGALLGGLPDSQRFALREYGRVLGLAFQIADDVLDYIGTEDEVGKPIGHDLLEGFATLPLMLAVERGAVEHITDGKRLDANEARLLAERIRMSDATKIALERARELASSATLELSALPESEASRTLASLTEYVVSRTF